GGARSGARRVEAHQAGLDVPGLVGDRRPHAHRHHARSWKVRGEAGPDAALRLDAPRRRPRLTEEAASEAGSTPPGAAKRTRWISGGEFTSTSRPGPRSGPARSRGRPRGPAAERTRARARPPAAPGPGGSASRP